MKKKIVIESRIEAIEKVYNWLQEILRERISPKLSQTILLVTQEMTTNAVLHGNKADPNKQVSVTYQQSDTQVMIDIEDEGGGIAKLPTPEEAQELDYLDENGRGLKLSVLMSDEIELHGSRVRLLFNTTNTLSKEET